MTFLFDLNGTMIDDMHFHQKVWHNVLTRLGAQLTADEVKKQMYGKNDELLVRVFGANRFSQAEMDAISQEKEIEYQALYKPHLRLIEGLPAFLEEASKKNIVMAIGSAAIPFNIDFVLDNLNIRHYFKAIVSAYDVKISKPDPEVFLKAAQLLDANPTDCIVFEDAPKGVEAAQRAGMKAVAITTIHSQEEFNGLPNITMFVNDYDDVRLNELLKR